jgi:hypothetical protein
MTDVEGTQRLFKDYEGEDRQAQKDDLLKKIQTNGYAYAQSLRLPNLPGNASDVSLKDAQSYLVTKAQNDSQFAAGVVTEQGGLEELVGGIKDDKLEGVAFAPTKDGKPLLNHGDKKYQEWATTYASLVGQKRAYEAFAGRVKDNKLASEDAPLVEGMVEAAARSQSQAYMDALKKEGKLSHDRIQNLGALYAEHIKRGKQTDIIADGVKVSLAELENKVKTHVETGAKEGKTLRGYVEGALQPMIAGKTEDFNIARGLLYDALK